MRQIEEFSTSYQHHINICMAWAAGLVAWAWISVALHMNGLDMRVVYTAVAVAIGIRTFKVVMALCMETKQTAQRYKSYLDTFSYAVLHRMRNDSSLSAWSRQEIDKYLNSAMCWGY